MTVQQSKSIPRGKRKKPWRLIAVSSIVATAFLVWLLFFAGVKRVQWMEDVALADGSVIAVTQERKFVKVTYELFQSGWQTRYNKITFPDGVSFESDDRMGFLHAERGTPPVRWILIASPFFCEAFNKYGRPKPDYIQFEFANGRWTYRTVQPEFFGRRVNLNVNDELIVVKQRSRVTIQDKEYWNSTSEGIHRDYLIINPKFESVCEPIINLGEKNGNT